MTTSRPHSSPPSNRFASLEQEVFLNLWRTYDRLGMLESELFSRYDLTGQQYNVLRLLQLKHPDAITTMSLAQRLVSRAPDITRMLNKLEERNLISRLRPDDNRRTVLISITAPGLALLEQIAAPLQECHERQLGHMSKADLKQFAALLKTARLPHEETDSHWR
ncbi:MAG: MarR family transcriptional regulator [Planctomycetaceae bacterium]